MPLSNRSPRRSTRSVNGRRMPFFFGFPVAFCHGFQKNQNEHRKNGCLNHTDQEFQKKKRKRDNQWCQTIDNRQQHLACKNISKQSRLSNRYFSRHLHYPHNGLLAFYVPIFNLFLRSKLLFYFFNVWINWWNQKIFRIRFIFINCFNCLYYISANWRFDSNLR